MSTTIYSKELFIWDRYAGNEKPPESPRVKLSPVGRRFRRQAHVGKQGQLPSRTVDVRADVRKSSRRNSLAANLSNLPYTSLKYPETSKADWCIQAQENALSEAMHFRVTVEVLNASNSTILKDSMHSQYLPGMHRTSTEAYISSQPAVLAGSST